MRVRKCPSCGYLVSVREWMQARHNYPCPRCKEQLLSGFEVTDILVDPEKYETEIEELR